MSAGDATPIAGPDALSYVDDAEPFSPEVQAILATPVSPELVELRPVKEGSSVELLYVNWIHYQTILIKAFGPGGFRMIPKGPPRQQGNVFTWHGSLWVRAPGKSKFQFIDEAVGECHIQSAGNGAEGAKSDCLTKCCKRLGIFMELFDPAWRRAWEAKYKNTHLRAKQDRQWVSRDRASGAAAPAPSTSRATDGQAPSSAAPAGEPAADTGEPMSDQQRDAIAAELKRRGWKKQYTVVFLKENFGVESLGALSAKQADAALAMILKRRGAA